MLRGKFFFPEATICKEREDPKYGNIAVKNQQSNSAVSAWLEVSLATGDTKCHVEQ